MITNVRKTSILAYAEKLETIGEQQLEVYKTLRKIQPANNLMISIESGIPLSSVCGRMFELRNKLKVVTFSHKAVCPVTKKNTNFWKLVRF